jgi:hypothetical protein
MVYCKEFFSQTFFLALSEHTKKSMTNEPLSIGTIGQQYLNMDLARPLIPVWPSKMYLSSSCSDNKSGPSPLTCLWKTKMRPAQLVHCSGHSQCLADASVDGEAALWVCGIMWLCHVIIFPWNSVYIKLYIECILPPHIWYLILYDMDGMQAKWISVTLTTLTINWLWRRGVFSSWSVSGTKSMTPWPSSSPSALPTSSPRHNLPSSW